MEKRIGLRRYMLGALAVASNILLGSCRDAPPPSDPSPLPVGVVTLEFLSPSIDMTVPGIVRSWAEQDVAFEIAGRIEFVIEAGAEVSGRWQEGDEVLLEGDLLARLDPSDFEAAVAAAEADLESVIIQRDQVAPAQLAEAQANKQQVDDQLARVEEALRRGAANESEAISARANAEVASAQVIAAQAGIESARASVLRAESALQQAKLNLERTELRAPFGAEVSGRTQIVGGYASPGAPVVSLTMVDPLEVAVQVSAATSRRIEVNSLVRVYADGLDEALLAKVLRKSTSADSGTQTFTITLICRNRLVTDDRIEDGVIRVPDVFQPQVERIGEGGPLFVDERRVLRRDDKGWFVWAFEGWSAVTPRPAELTLRRVSVTPGERRLNYQGIYILRSLDDLGELQQRQMLGADVPEQASDGDRALIASRRWAMRPGDVVRVDLAEIPADPGYYVPQEAVLVSGADEARVFVLGPGDVAQAVDVVAGPVVNGLQRVSGDQVDGFPPGTRVITTGASGVLDGDRVRIIGGEG